MSILYAVPIITSTASVLFAANQHFFFGLFLHPNVKQNAKQVFTPWWNAMVPTGLVYVIAPIVGTIASSLAIIKTSELVHEKGTGRWYIASAVLAAGHFAFVPLVLPRVKAMSNGGLSPFLDEWLRVHVIRSFTVDLGCWISAIIAFTKTLS
ncbi:hypothetical protein LX32DRAFT_719555 [Colletotrichum zoysiae]|uniref:Uncharacterized protein n=1 Tax=Colletotrichum zoysiae TaxID=1216348 RepID=A0AAD9HJ32_9PEZI|nr:hypothetical protein LX32DRAFT_719555 [Colletotrichum zoysiae]